MIVDRVPTSVPAPSEPRLVPVSIGSGQVLRMPDIPGLPGSDSAPIDLKRIFGPPAANSVRGKLDMAAVKAFQRIRTDAGNAWALRMAKDGHLNIWKDFAKRARAEVGGGYQAWLGTALLASTMATNGAATWAAKKAFDRPRPFQQDPSVTIPIPAPHGKSYPSGHASSAYAAARVISRLAPSLAKEAYDVARQVAVSRVYAGVHFPSDVVAGALLGTAIGEIALRSTGTAGRRG